MHWVWSRPCCTHQRGNLLIERLFCQSTFWIYSWCKELFCYLQRSGLTLQLWGEEYNLMIMSSTLLLLKWAFPANTHDLHGKQEIHLMDTVIYILHAFIVMYFLHAWPHLPGDLVIYFQHAWNLTTRRFGNAFSQYCKKTKVVST